MCAPEATFARDVPDSDYATADSAAVIASGFRYVVPYVDARTAFVKHRWAGRTAAEALVHEFSGLPESYVRWAIGAGLVTLDDEPCDAATVLRLGQRLRQVVHRHEIPVPVASLDSLHVVDHGAIVSVCKPAGWPCHPGGAYRHNSLTELLRKTGLERVSLLYRLDRVVSGVLLLVKGTTAEDGVGSVAAAYVRALAHPASVKVYVARVAGRFGGESTPDAASISDIAIKAIAATQLAASVSLRYPIVCLQRRRGVYDAGLHLAPEVAARGKAAETTVVPLLYDAASDTTLVLARPVTGRTHQLRVHLRAAGFAIANDPCYGPPQRSTAEAHIRADAVTVPLSWEVEAQLLRRKGLATATDGVLPRTCSLRELVERCPFCSRVRAATEVRATAADAGFANAFTATQLPEAPCTGPGIDDGDEDSENENGLAAISVRPRPFRIWLHALAYRVSSATGLPPPLEFHAGLPDWVAPVARRLVEEATQTWLASAEGAK